MTTVYVAHPIDQVTRLSPPLLRETGAELTRLEFSTYWPRMPWKFDGEIDLDIVGAVNRAAQQACDAVVAVLPLNTPTLGVPVEIETALNSGQPVVVISDIATSVQLQDWSARGAIVSGSPRNALLTLTEELDLVENAKPARLVLCVEDNVRLPQYSGDAGLDLVVSSDRLVLAGGRVDVPCGAGVALPDGMWGMIVGRSSTWGRGLSVDTRIIDAGYRGPLYANVHNISTLDVTIKAGERIVQLVPFHSNTHNMVLEQVDTLPPSERGQRGHGSSGK